MRLRWGERHHDPDIWHVSAVERVLGTVWLLSWALSQRLRNGAPGPPQRVSGATGAAETATTGPHSGSGLPDR